MRRVLESPSLTRTDGVFDFASNDAVAFLVAQSSGPDEAVEAVTSHAYDANGSKDNLSTLVVPLPAWGTVALPAPTLAHLM